MQSRRLCCSAMQCMPPSVLMRGHAACAAAAQRRPAVTRGELGSMT